MMTSIGEICIKLAALDGPYCSFTCSEEYQTRMWSLVSLQYYVLIVGYLNIEEYFWYISWYWASYSMWTWTFDRLTFPIGPHHVAFAWTTKKTALYCCIFIWCRRNVFTALLPSTDRITLFQYYELQPLLSDYYNFKAPYIKVHLLKMTHMGSNM
jgi:hypothetical protein